MNGKPKPANGTSEDAEADFDLAKLLKEFDAANEVADGVESKLDELLGTLDSMLSKLEDTKEQRDQAKKD
ncbi:hypothetical protein AURDEDRAFT_141263 [Auricularia subglabra TFB-10046 SS5]|nr:hypothetical protein AURDEDRAFT_141263 [Auricularia subglabra TFB-10046 SS5]